MCVYIHVHGYIWSIFQVFKAQRKGSLEAFAAKRITLKDSDQFDTQAEVVFLSHLMCTGLCHITIIFITIDGELILEGDESIAAVQTSKNSPIH